MNPIDGATLKRIKRAILDAYPRKADLAELVRFELNQKLDEIVAADNLNTMVFALLEWAEAHGKLDELVQAAARERPNSADLQALAELFSAYPAPPTSPTQCRAITRAGRLCKIKARPGSDYCHVHLRMLARAQ